MNLEDWQFQGKPNRRQKKQPMPKLSSVPAGFFFSGQLVHLALLAVLLATACAALDSHRLGERDLWEIDGRAWFAIALAVPVIHQIYVWIAWRSELCFGAVTERVGFVTYQAVFLVLLVSRPVSLILLTIADHDSFELAIPVRLLLCMLLGLPAAYTGYSVVRYFGIARAAGIDHFDESYRTKPLVKEGIFKYTSNSMYVFGFMGLWVIAFAGASWAAVVVA
ncbi:MAG: phosphatidylethanolamine N-methyltransferase family protein, partial [Planctomycetales bacterium]